MIKFVWGANKYLRRTHVDYPTQTDSPFIAGLTNHHASAFFVHSASHSVFCDMMGVVRSFQRNVPDHIEINACWLAIDNHMKALNYSSARFVPLTLF